MATSTSRTPRRIARARSRSRRWGPAVAIAAVALVLVPVVGSDRASSPAPSRAAGMQRVLDGLVSGPRRIAPGVAAYVAGPHGSWSGAAGLANIATGAQMRPDARLHLESISKAWGAVVILQLVGEGRMRLDDTVDRWLPGLLPSGDRITVHQLLTHTSGLVDSNDLNGAMLERVLRRLRDRRLAAAARRLDRRIKENPTIKASPRLIVRLAAALPLRTPPGESYYYSNIGYIVVQMIAARAGGRPFPELVRDRIIRPLGLRSAVYQPQGEVRGPHPRDYSLDERGHATDATGWYRVGQGIDAGIVATARDEATFLTALTRGALLRPPQLRALRAPTAASQGYALGFEVKGARCAIALQHNGGSYATLGSVFVADDGSRVAVVLANGNVLEAPNRLDPRAGAAIMEAARRLFCAA